ncbi:MAG: DUF3137 domain-containing protein [Pseudomonadota bacterium]
MLDEDPDFIDSNDDENDPLQNHEAPIIDPDDAVLQRRDDQRFVTEMERIVDEAESVRLKYMESRRLRRFLHTIVTILCVVGGSAGFVWYLLLELNLQMALLSILAALVIPGVIGLIKDGPVKAYKKHHKQKFMPEMARALGGFRYFEKRGIGTKVIKKSGVISPFKHYEAEDCFMGLYQDVKVIMSEARLYASAMKRKSVFDGLFILMEMPENIFEGHTIITADQGLARAYADTRWKGLKHLKTPEDDPEWKRFLIYTNNVEAAEKQIDNVLFKELLETAQIFDDAPLSAVMFGKKFLFLAIPHAEDMFEASNIFVPVTLKSYIEKCRKELDKMMEIIDLYELYAKNRD